MQKKRRGKQKYTGLVRNYIAEYRRINGWTQQQAADWCGCHVSAFNRIENNSRPAPDYIVRRLAQAWKLNHSDLIKIKDE